MHIHTHVRRELAEQSKKHGNDLFGWGKKNPAQYANCLKSYTVRTRDVFVFFFFYYHV